MPPLNRQRSNATFLCLEYNLSFNSLNRHEHWMKIFALDCQVLKK